MENIETPQELSKEEQLEKQYRKKGRELKIARARAGVLRNQTTEAYRILENIRFDYLSDTMFRDYYVDAKNKLESALSDFLLDDNYWKQAIEKHNLLSPQEYDENLKQPLFGEIK